MKCCRVRPECAWCAGLDSSQVQAVSLALSSQDIALVHGPPGTGEVLTHQARVLAPLSVCWDLSQSHTQTCFIDQILVNICQAWVCFSLGAYSCGCLSRVQCALANVSWASWYHYNFQSNQVSVHNCLLCAPGTTFETKMQSP